MDGHCWTRTLSTGKSWCHSVKGHLALSNSSSPTAHAQTAYLPAPPRHRPRSKNARFITGVDQRLPRATTDEHAISTHSPDGTILGGDAWRFLPSADNVQEMTNHSSNSEVGSEHADNLLPSKGGICARCGKFIAPISGAMSKHDEQTIALVRSGLTVSAIKLLRDNTRCDLSVAKEMVEHMHGLMHRPLGRPCPSCAVPLRTPRAKLCAHCGARVAQ